MKMTKQNQFFSSLQRLLRHAALASLGVLTLAPSADAQRPGILSDEDWVGTLPSIHVGPEEILRSGVEQGISAFYVEGPWRQVLDAAMNAGGGRVSVEVLSNEEFRAVFHGDQVLTFDLELIDATGINWGVRTETASGVVALQVGDRYVRSQRLQGDLRIPMKRLERLGFLESGVTLHSHDNLGGQSRTSMRAIAGRLYLFQSS